MAAKFRRLQFAQRFLLLLLFLIGVSITETSAAQSSPRVIALQTTTLTGWLAILYGDPPPGSNLPPRSMTHLIDHQGDLLARLLVDEAVARPFNRQRVLVTVQEGDASTASLDNAPAYVVIDIQPLAGGQPRDVSAQLAGSQPYVNIKCSFSDRGTPPKADPWYAGLLGSSYPALGHYWSQTSLNTINLNGSTTQAQWYNLEKPQSQYLLPNGAANLNLLLQDCVNKANPSVNFALYVGINMFFDGPLDCCAWGGWSYLTLDGVTRIFQLTWLPDWINLATLGHEMGHGFGLPHSSGPAASPPTGLNIYVSSWDIMSRSSHFLYSTNDPTYGHLPPGTIAYHLDKLNWIPANRRLTVNSGEDVTVTLEQLQLPNSNGNYLIARVPIGGSPTRFYTVEARRRTGYDVNIPGAAVIIHHVLVGRVGNAGDALVVDGDSNGNVNDAGAMWLPGETFTDAVNNIQISVLSATASGYTVYISNNVSPIAAPVRNYHRPTAPVLRWSRVEWAVGYRVQVDDETTFTAPPVNADVPASQLSFNAAVGDGLYYWRVCALRTKTTCGSWSPVEAFRVVGP